MKPDLLLKIQRILAYIFIALTLLSFILSLGFMTNYYTLFYEGTFEMFNFFKDVQVLNKAIFNTSLIYVILAILLIPFDINKKKPGIFGVSFVIITTVYTLLSSYKILSDIPYYKNIYASFDFGEIKNYTPSIVAFDLSTVLFIVIIIAAILLFITSLSNYISTIKTKRIRGGSNEA
ncbi:hypothetical protein SH1V18_18970 [Vallitalea longa]|uniref:Uncharacterized protein n=1 Tax=Vallitalea longa TaxID=2936439 RepID=A0A9W6DFF0_9FIRM|nr:hypothetical protein [Vallitalea longa]GKX29417.1 hypothetical protein SH1V18_18970 [Vallitalea longa]